MLGFHDSRIDTSDPSRCSRGVTADGGRVSACRPSATTTEPPAYELNVSWERGQRAPATAASTPFAEPPRPTRRHSGWLFTRGRPGIVGRSSVSRRIRRLADDGAPHASVPGRPSRRRWSRIPRGDRGRVPDPVRGTPRAGTRYRRVGSAGVTGSVRRRPTRWRTAGTASPLRRPGRGSFDSRERGIYISIYRPSVGGCIDR